MTKLNASRSGLRSRLRKVWWIGIPIGSLVVFGLGCIDGLAPLLQIFMLLLGVNPAASFPSTGQVNFGLVQMQEDGTNAAGDDKEQDVFVDVTDPPGTKATVDTVETEPVYDKGSFTLLIDSSGSMEKSYNSGVCDLCPYDSERRRVDAAQILIQEVLKRAGESRMAVYEFDPDADANREAGDTSASVTTELVGYTSDQSALDAATKKTGSNGGTYIYDSLLEILDTMDTDIKAHFQTEQVNKAIIVITDGEDTESLASLDQVVAEAQRLDVPIHVIGLGKASENFRDLYQTDENNSALVRSLQELASETHGFYLSVNNDEDLSALGERVGLALAAGHDEVKVTLDPVPQPGTVVKGNIGLAGSGSTSSWSFLAP